MSWFLFYLLLAVIFLCVVAFFGYGRNRNLRLNNAFTRVTLAVLLWGVGSLGFLKLPGYLGPYLFSRLAAIGIVLVPVFYYRFFCLWLGLNNKTVNRFLKISWVLAFVFILFDCWLPWEVLRYGLQSFPMQLAGGDWWKYRQTEYFLVYLLYFWVLLGQVFIMLLQSYKTAQITQKNRIKYFLVATGLSWLLTTLNWLAGFKFYAYSYAGFLAGFYPFVFGYALITWRLMDIKLGVTRAAAFILVYSAVFALPFWLAYKYYAWEEALWLMCLLSIPSPFIYNYFVLAAQKLLIDQHKDYKANLEEFIKSNGQLKDPQIALQELTEQIHRAIEARYCALYLLEPQRMSYRLRCAYFTKERSLVQTIAPAAALINYLTSKRKVLNGDTQISKFAFFEDGLIIPYFERKVLLGFNVVGPKLNGQNYKMEDINLFESLADRINLSLANWALAKEKEGLAQQEQQRRQQAMDHFSASMAHEIDNPIYAVTGLAEMLKLKVSKDLKPQLKPDDAHYLLDRLERLIHDIGRISKMIKAIREFSSKTDGSFDNLAVDELIDDFKRIVAPQFSHEGIRFECNVERGIVLKANKIYLEEVLVNLALNALHAVKHNRKKEKNVELAIWAQKDSVMIELKDNGYGIKKEMLEDIFLDFVTTKASTEGTGMGLARVRKIVEMHQGKVWAESPGWGKGATFYLQLPKLFKDFS